MLTIRELPGREELRKQQIEKQVQKNEQAKEVRRQQILEQIKQEEDPWMSPRQRLDPWQGQPPSEGKSKGKGKTAAKTGKNSEQTNAQATSSVDNELQSTVHQLRSDVDSLTQRMNHQERQIEGLQFQITGNHQEIMSAFRSLGANAASSTEQTGSQRPAGKKRQPDIGNTPLKALANRPTRG